MPPPHPTIAKKLPKLAPEMGARRCPSTKKPQNRPPGVAYVGSCVGLCRKRTLGMECGHVLCAERSEGTCSQLSMNIFQPRSQPPCRPVVERCSCNATEDAVSGHCGGQRTTFCPLGSTVSYLTAAVSVRTSTEGGQEKKEVPKPLCVSSACLSRHICQLPSLTHVWGKLSDEWQSSATNSKCDRSSMTPLLEDQWSCTFDTHTRHHER